MIGRVIKIFSDFYYVETDFGIVESKIRTVLKKQKQEICTGDFVELEQFDKNSMQAFISSVKGRKNLLTRPKVANITQVIIVSALKEPDLSFEQLDRFIAHCEYHNIKPVLCFNKEDIVNSDDLKQRIIDTYSRLNYDILFTSALQKTGIEELRPILRANTTILCGQSGAGKSSLINAIFNETRLRTLPVSDKTKRGVHTTRHCELIQIEQDTFIVDTPGFSQLKFDFLLPVDVQKLFVEFKNVNNVCKFKNCLHINEKGCAASEVVKNISKSRLDSYIKFVDEALEYQNRISKISVKNESFVKYNKNKLITKISNKKRNLSRKTINQNINREEMH